MGAQISTNLSSCCSLREQRYLNIKSKADLGRYIKDANKSTLMVINFTTTWCQPCIDAEPPMRKLAEEFPDVRFARVDIDLLHNVHTNAPPKAVSGDDSQDVVKEFNLKTMPTLLLCKKVDDGLDKGKGAAEVSGGNGSGNRISSDNNVEGNSVVRSPKIIDEIDRMEGPLDGCESRLYESRLRKKIEYYKNNFKSTDEFYSYLEKSKQTQLMVINFTTERSELCKKAEESFKKLQNSYEDVKFAKVDVEVHVLMNIAKELDVTKMPTFLLVKVKKLEKEHIKKDGVQGDHKEKKEPPVLNKRYKMVELDRVVGWDDNKEGELSGIIKRHRYTTT